MNQNWNLIFEEIFENLDNWSFDTGSGKKGLWGNNEQEFYTSSNTNCFIENNNLNIISLNEKKEDCNYTSARLNTKEKFIFKYGYVEVKAKLPTGKGSWPAIWMMGINNSWPTCGEIDIMEHLGREQDIIHHAVHFENHICDSEYAFLEKIDNVTKEFHTYGVLWKKDYIGFYVDRKLRGEIIRKESINWPFNDYFYLIVNCAVGGDWAGNIDDKDLPFNFIIDNIKVWQER